MTPESVPSLSHHHHLPTPPHGLHSPAVRRAHRPQWRWTDRWKARGSRHGMDGRKEERERCDPHSRASSIFRRKCPNWQAAGRATALHCYPTPCPSPPQPSLLIVSHLLPPLSAISFVFCSSCALLHLPFHPSLPHP